MSYDRADYDPTQFSVRIAFFVTWAMLTGLEGKLHKEDNQELLALLRQREITPREFLEDDCDCKFWEEDLSSEGNSFARDYYLGQTNQANYFQDYEQILLTENADLQTVINSWSNYDKIAVIINRRYQTWKGSRHDG